MKDRRIYMVSIQFGEYSVKGEKLFFQLVILKHDRVLKVEV